MAIPIVGRGTKIGWSAAEGTWNTAATRVKFAPLISFGVNQQVIREMVPELHHDDAGYEQNTYDASKLTQGPFSLVMRYDHLGYLLDSAIAAGSTAGTGAPYTHTWTPTSSLDLPSQSFEFYRGSAANSQTAAGCKVRSAVWKVSPGSPMTLDLDVIGGTMADRASPTTYTAPTTALYVLGHHAGTLTYNSVAYKVESFEFRVENALGELMELGSLESSEMPISNFRTCRCRVTLNEPSDAIHVAQRAGTSASATITFTRPVSGETLQFNMVNAIVDPVSDGISGPGPVKVSFDLRPRGSGATAPFSIVITNTNANRYD